MAGENIYKHFWGRMKVISIFRSYLSSRTVFFGMKKNYLILYFNYENFFITNADFPVMFYSLIQTKFALYPLRLITSLRISFPTTECNRNLRSHPWHSSWRWSVSIILRKQWIWQSLLTFEMCSVKVDFAKVEPTSNTEWAPKFSLNFLPY